MEKTEPVQVCFTLRLRDQWGKWMQDGCKVYMDSYMASNGINVSWWLGLFSSLRGRPNTKPGDYSTPKSCNHRFIILYHVWGPRMNRSSLDIAFGWVPHHMWMHTTLEGMWPHYMSLEVSWDNLWKFLFDSHSFMIMALGLCVKWPSNPLSKKERKSIASYSFTLLKQEQRLTLNVGTNTLISW